jgi:Spy/CpxP family protein refolding chaperone
MPCTQAAFASGHERFDPLADMSSELDLSDAQQTKLRALQDELTPKMQQLRAQAHEARHAFMEMLHDEEATEAQLKSANEAVVKATTALMEARFERMLAVRGILSRNQLKVFLLRLEEHRRAGRRGHGEN